MKPQTFFLEQRVFRNGNESIEDRGLLLALTADAITHAFLDMVYSGIIKNSSDYARRAWLEADHPDALKTLVIEMDEELTVRLVPRLTYPGLSEIFGDDA